jgi:predicted lipoprotein with Yx(FWY)xxD motif
MNRLKSSASFSLFVVLISSLLLSACGQVGNPSLNPTQVLTIAAVDQNGAIPATGNQPQVIANDQTFDGSSVVIDKVISKGPGWLAIHNQKNGDVGPVIGYTHLNDGENDMVVVKIDPKQATPVMYAMLHVDAGQVGTYEYPGPDIPAFLNGQMISPAFKITAGQASSVTPGVTVHDQSVSAGKVVIDKVVSNGPGWLAIHFQRPDGTPGDEIGYAAVKNGVNQNVVVTIDPSKATPVMYAMLHVDKGQVGTYEFPGVDTPVMVSGLMVDPTFKTNLTSANAAQSPGAPQPSSPAPTPESMNMGPAQPSQAPSTSGSPLAPPTATNANTTPNGMSAAGAASSGGSTTGGTPPGGMVVITPAPSNNPLVKVSDQIPQNGTVKVDNVVSSGPGWIVIYSVTNGQPDQPIGHSPVHPGDNQNVIVHIDTSKATDPLYAQLHVDTGTIGVFEFPGPDVPVMLGVKMISGMFKNSANPTNTQVASVPPTQSNTIASIDVQDQPIHDSAIMIHQVVSVGDGWVVVHPQNPDGTPGNFIGFAQVHNGVNTNVLVRLDVKRVTSTVYAMLHVNASKAPIPQYPGPDVPVMANGKMLLPSFRITGPVNGDVPLTASKTSSGTAFLADGWGMALYMFLNDTPGKSNCTGDCLNAFRPLLASGMITAGNGVALNKVSAINLPDGTRQVTYGGSPLYYYIYDKIPGDTQAQGLNGLWFLIGP